MVEYERTQDREPTDLPKIRICVAGVGGGGLNVLDRICLDRLMDVTLVSMHTDVRVLSHAMAPVKIQLGADIMRGIGCGGDPELGREAAEASREQIKNAIQGHEMVFICTGLGGGTGSGAAPVVAEIAKELGSLVFVFATVPFSFEGRRRITQAEVALEELQRSADALVLFENNRMGELVLPKEGIQKAFSQADQLIGHSVRAIASMVTQPGIVRVGLADLMSALRSPNARCLFGFGEARGANRVQEALKRALKSPLVNQGLLLQNAKNLLVHISGGETLALAEVDALMKQLGKHVPEQTQIMFGLAVDPKLGDLLSVTLVSSLSAQEMALETSTRAVERIPTRPTDAARPLVKPSPAKPQSSTLGAALASSGGNGVHLPLHPEPAPVSTVQPELLARPAPVATPPHPPMADLFAQAAEPPPAPELIHTTVVQTVSEPAAPPPTLQWFAGDKVPVAPAVALQTNPEPGAAPAPAVIPPSSVTLPSVSAAPAAVGEPVAPAPVVPPVVPAPVHRAVDESIPRSTTKDEPPTAIMKASIFSVLDDEDDDGSSHWADKYIQPKQQGAVPPVVEPRRDPVRPPERSPAPVSAPAAVPAASTPPPPATKPAADFQQSSLKLDRDEIARFKGTDKTIVDGDDLDVPTWMRIRGKVKR